MAHPNIWGMARTCSTRLRFPPCTDALHQRYVLRNPGTLSGELMGWTPPCQDGNKVSD